MKSIMSSIAPSDSKSSELQAIIKFDGDPSSQWERLSGSNSSSKPFGCDIYYLHWAKRAAPLHQEHTATLSTPARIVGGCACHTPQESALLRRTSDKC